MSADLTLMMTEIRRLSESDEPEVKSEYEEELPEDVEKFPKILEFVRSLQTRIKWQKKKIEKLRKKLLKPKKQQSLGKKVVLVNAEIQTDFPPLEQSSVSSQNWDTSENKHESLIDQVKQAAESAVQQTGFVYEETSGLYYDFSSGYYYDANQGLYYDGNSGTYYSYDEETKSYKFHSQAQVVQNEAAVRHENLEKKEKRKARKAHKDKVKKPKRRKEAGYETEEGECSDDSHSSLDESPEKYFSDESENEDEQDLAKTYPPCMRIIVKETNLSKLKVGSLFLVTCTGGSLGREGDHSVLIPDLNISKYHARFQYDEENKRYMIVDSGSRNGTFLNSKRMSVAKQESDPCEVAHGAIIQVGNTKLLCHIHNGHETCGHCEPGLVQQNTIVDGESSTVINRRDQHKTELRRLKNKFGVEKNNTDAASQVASGYQDRAQARREYVGSSNHHVKTQQSSVETSIAKDNKGFKLLSKMGWSEGQSLGKDGDGRIEPVPLVNKQSKAGFGALNAELSDIKVDPNVRKKHKLWRKTQQRYNELSD